MWQQDFSSKFHDTMKIQVHRRTKENFISSIFENKKILLNIFKLSPLF